MNQSELVSIIVPALNEAESLDELYERTRQAMEGLPPFEFIVVDDGSTDDTVDRAKALRRTYGNVCILSHHRNHGKSLALMQGFAAARGEIAVLMDAGLQDKPELIPLFLAKMAEGYDLVNGWRNGRRDDHSRLFVSRVFSTLASRFLHCPVHDIDCGFKAIRKSFYKRLELRGDLHRLIPALVAGWGGRVTEIAIPRAPSRDGSSRCPLVGHRGLFDIIALSASSASRFRPFRLLCQVGAIFWAVALVALVGWCGLTLYGADGAAWMRIVRPLTALLGIGSGLIGTMLPLLGLQVEIAAARQEDAHWRRGLLKLSMKPRTGDRERRFNPEGSSVPRRFPKIVESDLEPFSEVEEAFSR